MNKTYWQHLNGPQRGWRIGFLLGLIFLFFGPIVFTLDLILDPFILHCPDGFVSCYFASIPLFILFTIPLMTLFVTLGAIIGYFFKKKEAP